LAIRQSIDVLVTKIGGVSGTDKVAVCTFTYDIFDAIFDEGKTSKLNTASGGAALSLDQKLDGTWVLTWVDEKPANEKDCT
jgi:hypothetical protein